MKVSSDVKSDTHAADGWKSGSMGVLGGQGWFWKVLQDSGNCLEGTEIRTAPKKVDGTAVSAHGLCVSENDYKSVDHDVCSWK